MASTIVHLAVIGELIKLRRFAEPSRLKFGAVIADFAEGNSHMKMNIDGGLKKTYDLDAFRSAFGERMLRDDLYLGYYLHLIQDAVFRHFVYDKHGWDPVPTGNVDRLHNDYALANRYIIEKYHLTNDIAVPNGFEDELINEICSFNTRHLIDSVNAFFGVSASGEPFFFTRTMSDEFIAEAVAFCANEIDDLRRGGKGADMYACAWDKKA